MASIKSLLEGNLEIADVEKMNCNEGHHYYRIYVESMDNSDVLGIFIDIPVEVYHKYFPN